jgi:hypothetical protein
MKQIHKIDHRGSYQSVHKVHDRDGTLKQLDRLCWNFQDI